MPLSGSDDFVVCTLMLTLYDEDGLEISSAWRYQYSSFARGYRYQLTRRRRTASFRGRASGLTAALLSAALADLELEAWIARR